MVSQHTCQRVESGRSPPGNGQVAIKVLHEKKGRFFIATQCAGIWLVAHAGTSAVENRLVPPQQPLRGRRNIPPRNSAAFAPHDQQSACCLSCADGKNLDELIGTPPPCNLVSLRPPESIRLRRPRAVVGGARTLWRTREDANRCPPVSRWHASSRAL